MAIVNEFNKTQLGHKFEVLFSWEDNDIDFICKQCGVKVFFSYWRNVQLVVVGEVTKGPLLLTCNEYIIKNILE